MAGEERPRCGDDEKGKHPGPGEETPNGSGGYDEKGKCPEAEEERPRGSGVDDEKGKYPVGFRFKPTLDELVTHYLVPNLLGKPTLENNKIIEADAYECDPEILTERFKNKGEDDTWYFLSPRYRRYTGGDRPTRGTSDERGRWKPSTGQRQPKPEMQASAVPFTKNSLAYHVGPKKDETRTKWLMLELVAVPTPQNGLINSESAAAAGPSSDGKSKLNEYVICKIYKSPMKKWRDGEEGSSSGASSASACEAEVPASSQPSSPSPESAGGTATTPTPSSTGAGKKRPTAEKPSASGHANARNKRVSPGGPSAPAHGNGGGMQVPVGLGAASYHGEPGQPAPMQPPAMYNIMRPPVQLQRPRLMYGYNNNNNRTMVGPSGQEAPAGQRPPVLRPVPPPHWAASTGCNSLGRVTMMMRDMRPPNNLAAGHPVRPPSFYLRTPRPQQQRPVMEGANAHQQERPWEPELETIWGPVQQPPQPLMYGYNNIRTVVVPNGQAPGLGQGAPGLWQFPAHRAAAAGPNSLAGTTMTRPPSLAAGQPVRAPSSFPRPPCQQPVMEEEDADAHRQRVMAQLVAEHHKLQEARQAGSASGAGQQQTGPTAFTPPACLDEGVNGPVADNVTAPHNSNTCNGVQQQQQQQSNSAAPAGGGDSPSILSYWSREVQTMDAERGTATRVSNNSVKS